MSGSNWTPNADNKSLHVIYILVTVTTTKDHTHPKSPAEHAILLSVLSSSLPIVSMNVNIQGT